MEKPSKSEKLPDVEVTVSIAPALASWLKYSGEKRGESLAQVVRGEIELLFYQNLYDLEALSGSFEYFFPGIRDEANMWGRREYPTRALKANEILPPNDDAEPCLVKDCCEEASRTKILRIEFPTNEDEVALAGVSSLLEVPICNKHARIYEVAESSSKIVEAKVEA
jgi:hypothetical protein